MNYMNKLFKANKDIINLSVIFGSKIIIKLINEKSFEKRR